MANSKSTRSNNRTIALVSGSEFAAGPRYVSLVKAVFEPSLS
jgi:hypothetical protein